MLQNFKTVSLPLLARGIVPFAVSAAALFAGQAGYAQTAPATPAGFLKWSMDKYAALPTFETVCQWSLLVNETEGGKGIRKLQVAGPNRFKLVSTALSTQATQTTVSDGAKLLEYSSIGTFPAQSYTAPENIAEARTMLVGNPMLSGLLALKFFGGAGRYSGLVNDSKTPAAFGPSVTLDGQPCKIIKFVAAGLFGSAEAAIGTQDGLVHRIRYHCEPLVVQASKAMDSPEFKAQMKKAGVANGEMLRQSLPRTMTVTEMYTETHTGRPIEETVFAVKAPEGQDVQEAGGGAEPKPPVALGTPAPDFTLTGMDGQKRKLTDLRGKVVLIDFWATWCPPCRKGLPETQKFYTKYGQKGLAVLAVSDEKKAEVAAFLKQNKYIFPSYLDTTRAMSDAYKIAAIPTVVIIDAKGNLAAYMVGLSPAEDILASLKKAGLKTE